RGEADRAAELERFEHMTIELEHGDLILRQLQAKGIRHLVMAGGIARRPNLRKIRLSWRAISNLPTLIRAMTKGDDKLLRGFIRSVESYGIAIHAPHGIVPELLAQRGSMTRRSPSKSGLADISAGFEAARAIGALD